VAATFSFLLVAAYLIATLGLAVYGANCYVMVALFLRRRRMVQDTADIIAAAAPTFARPEELPVVTTQIPLYNEANVAERSMRAAAAIVYPPDRHEIQVMDDSDDETRDIVDRVAGELRAQGHWISVVRRSHRTGYKAGALAAGLREAAGELIAIFDADFVPPPHFLRHTVPFFVSQPRIGIVQARWGHLNPADSLLTRAQAIGIDGHFMVEQSARTFNGLLMNFNGTAGVWRRQAILDAGGWSADTLTEDLDLSYRAQLAGWKTHFIEALEAPGELPATVAAFKSQQFRWAKGSIQTARKLLPRVWRERELSWWVKLQATLHLTHYAVHPLMLIVALLALPMMLIFPEAFPPGLRVALIVAMGLSLIAPNALYLASQRALYHRWFRHLCWLPALMCIGVGIALSNSRAVIEGLLGRPSEFVRTPKQGDRRRKAYHVGVPVLPWIEVALGCYCLGSLGFYFAGDRLVIGPFLLIYALGFLTTGVVGLWEMRRERDDAVAPAAALSPGAALRAD